MNACGAGPCSRLEPHLSWPAKVANLGVIVVALTACFDDTAAPTPPVGGVSMSLEAGDHQVGEVGKTLAQPIVVRLTDGSGVSVQGLTVHFDGNGRITTLSNEFGLASVPWQLREVAGPQTVRASLEAYGAIPITFYAVGVAGPPATISVPVGGDAVAVAGTELDTVTLIVSDRFANVVERSSLSWSVVTGGGSLRPLSTETDGLGRARAVWTLGPAVGAQRVIVTSGAASRTLNATAVPALVGRRVVAGFDHSCALVDDGTALCWGANWAGQLGIGVTDRNPHRVPEAVAGGLKFTSLAAGASHTCGLSLDGGAWCWGGGTAAPTRVTGAPAFSQLAAGAFHTCGLTSSGAVYCWGDNSLGQLGNGADRSAPAPNFNLLQPTPTPVAGSLTFTSITAAYSITCGASTTGVAYCWGGNVERVLGSAGQQTCRISIEDWDETYLSDEPCSTSPQFVPTKTAVSSVVSWQYGACAILTTAELQCWGARTNPTVVPGASVTSAWLLWGTVCALETSGTVSCWRSTAPFSVERPFGEGPTLVNLHTSGRHHCGLEKVVATVYCWGANFDGAVGDGTTLHRQRPVPVAASIGARSP